MAIVRACRPARSQTSPLIARSARLLHAANTGTHCSGRRRSACELRRLSSAYSQYTVENISSRLRPRRRRHCEPAAGRKQSSARQARPCAGHPRLNGVSPNKSWMAGTSLAMTMARPHQLPGTLIIRWVFGAKFGFVLGRHPLKRKQDGRVAERFKAPVLKTGSGATHSWVRIPPLPPTSVLRCLCARSGDLVFTFMSTLPPQADINGDKPGVS
jgi:hypothetical protein